MKYVSTRKNDELVSFKDAVINGLSSNGGLYFPESIPKLPKEFFDKIGDYSDHEIAFAAMMPYVEGSLSPKQLKEVIAEAITFPTPVVPITDHIHALELFHGPTEAFKDVGARFMSRCLSRFYSDNEQDVTILVATSGDTGSAVANGFYDVPGVEVKILFPKGKISPYQEYQ
ncbi:MAG: threonine synthase, partial [Flavobacteriales bacterium]|nr:threonine synthase [Flavobacteriales bacterium]